ncbi:MAG: hypothetical protein HYZ27_00490 [Deltaproteobacteria bacterium]|nr:hypothetical protein [Deltaproteobacteria bacterium]
MMLWVTLLPAAVGPLLDPIEGTEVSAADRMLLPSGQHLGYLADVWLVDVLSLQQNGGAIALFDRLYLSAHGRAWSQTRFLLNDVDVTDPARPGSPLVELPHEAWDALTHQSLWTASPGFHWRLDPTVHSAARAQGSGGAPIGGPLLLPEGFMNREPATRAGAPSDRRELLSAFVQLAEGSVAGASASGRLLVEAIEHIRRYPTLDNASGEAIDDTSRRTTVLGSGSLKLAETWVHGVAVWQETARSHMGAEARLPEALTRDTEASAFAGQLRTTLNPAPDAHLRLSAGVNVRQDDEVLRSLGPIVTDIEGEWLVMARPSLGERLRRSSIVGGAELSLAHGFSGRLSADHAVITSHPRLRTLAQTYDRGADRSVSMTLFDPGQRAEEWLRTARGEVEWRGVMAGLSLNAMVALDHAAVGVPGRATLSFVSPAAGVALRRGFGESEVFLLVRSEPSRLGAHAAAFLDDKRPSGLRTTWEDDGDAVPEPNESGEVLSRTGGRFHTADEDVRRPASHHLALGVKTPAWGPLRALVTGVARMETHRFTVRYSDEVRDSFSPVAFHDPGGDGRGEDPAPTGGQDLTVYARDPQSAGREIYVLDNAGKPSWFLGAELQLVSVAATWWFVNLGATGYWSFSGAAFGNFPDRNDGGVIDEASADPNNAVHEYGRPDSDRSFGVNLMAGLLPRDDLSVAMALRYRDGQPFTRIVIAELPQGPTPLMAVQRGGPRHTFHMRVDARARYRFDAGPFAASLMVDGYNLLGPGSEILEDPRAGASFRAPLEMVPARAVMATLEVAWRALEQVTSSAP